MVPWSRFVTAPPATLVDRMLDPVDGGMIAETLRHIEAVTDRTVTVELAAA